MFLKNIRIPHLEGPYHTYNSELAQERRKIRMDENLIVYHSENCSQFVQSLTYGIVYAKGLTAKFFSL